MKTPPLVLFALLAIAPSARAATPTSLAGWTAWNAFEAPSGAQPKATAYEDGIIFCDMGGQTIFRKQLAGRKFKCVVVGSAAGEPEGVGGQFAEGEAIYEASSDPITAALGQGGILSMKLKEIPRIDRTIVMVAPKPAWQVPYRSYVVGGSHRNAKAAVAPVGGPAVGGNASAALAAPEPLPDAPVSSGEAPAAPPVPPLTQDEIAVLSPMEASSYDGIKRAATKNGVFNPEDPSVQNTARKYRERIEREKRLDVPAIPPSDDMTLAQFNLMPTFQQRQFCANYPPDGAAVAKDTRGAEIDNSPDAMAGVKASVANPGPRPGDAPAKKPDTKWKEKDRRDACRALPVEDPTAGAPTGQTGGGGGNHAIDKLSNAEPEAKKPNSWITKGLLQQGGRGMLLGLIIGSLFGPVGLVLGPLIGGALLYGFAKKEAIDADKKK